jgi:ribosomal protein S18 acetylase RimI-like enzyme
MAKVVTPARDQILAFCAEDPVERVFLEEMALRGAERFAAVEGDGFLAGLVYVGINVVPAGRGCGAFADIVAGERPRMLFGEDGAVAELWEAVRRSLPTPSLDRPGQPVFVTGGIPDAGDSGLRPALPEDLELLLPACASAHFEELEVDPLTQDPAGFRRRTLTQIEEGRSWLWAEDGVILFKAEASAWTPHAVQLQQVWVDPQVRNRGYGKRGLADLCRLLLERAPAVCLFARPENAPAIRVYEGIDMRRTTTYRSILF